MGSVYIKCLAVIDSCKTVEHFFRASTFVWLAYKSKAITDEMYTNLQIYLNGKLKRI